MATLKRKGVGSSWTDHGRGPSGKAKLQNSLCLSGIRWNVERGGQVDEMKRRILGVLADAQAEIDSRPAAEWRPWWQVERDRADREAGPLWYPSDMLGDGEPLPERIRAQANQCLRRLADEGLVVVTTDGGRRRAKLTAAGMQLAAELAGNTTAVMTNAATTRCDE